ncbi:MAG: PKD domain-containing protein, partial [Bacteroidota bacterium]|nr:PKD domain-containing protein [Bacteroidota bacterium]
NFTTDSKYLNSFISVHENPSASISSSSNSIGCVPLVINFSDASTSVAGITNWQWDFGDGGSSTLQNPYHEFLSSGIFSITLIVTDANGCQNMIIEQNMIQVEDPPEADFNADITYSCNSSQDVLFTNNSVNYSNYFWDFDDGNTSVLQNPIHNYSTGTYSPMLIVSNNICYDTLYLHDYIEVGATLHPLFHVDTNRSCKGSLFNFTDVTNNNPDSWFWDFGDGNTSIVQNPTHSYLNSGVYDVTLTVSKDGNCLNSLIRFGIVEVLELPEINFLADTVYSCNPPFTTSFYDITPNAVSWNWSFGNGLTSTLQNPSNILFDTSGLYDVSLFVEDVNGCQSSDIFTSYIKVDDFQASGFSLQNSGCTPFTVDFLDQSHSIVSINVWSWDFGDGNFSSQKDPTHEYLNSGTYDITLSIENSFGCISSQAYSSYIEVGDKPVTNFSASSTISCVGEDIDFQDLSFPNSSITSWHWDFGDGNFSGQNNTSHQYQINGSYDVSLITSINGCSDTLLVNDYIEILGPTAFFKDIHTCSNPLEIKFENHSTGMDSVLWDFGDGTFSTVTNPIHSFSTVGLYTVVLSVKDIINDCANEFVKLVEVTIPEANFTYLSNSNNGPEDSIGCRPKRVYLQNLSENFSYYKVLWEDGYIGYGRTDHLFDTTGTFDVSMIVTDQYGCKDTFTNYNMFSIHDVKANFELLNMMGCDSVLAKFEDLSMPSSFVTWDFGDGGSSNLNNPSHMYYNEGFYDVTLYVESMYGCKDTLEKVEYIKFQYPVSDFNAPVLDICPGDSIHFQSTSSGMDLIYNWDFGDSSYSNITNPSHLYLRKGEYDVKLTVIDSFGCPDTLELINYINVHKPEADFSYASISSPCPPLISTFNNQSSNDVVSWCWDFGDGGSALNSDPSHLYSSSGTFNVTLIVKNNIGCLDTIIKNNLVNISGPTGFFNVSDTFVCARDSILFSPFVLNADNYFWDFGDGIYSYDSLPLHSYVQSGTYNPSLVITNNSGCQLTVPSPSEIEVRNIEVSAGIDHSICLGEKVQFNAVGDGSVFSWNPVSTLNNSNISNPIASPLNSTLYIVTNSDGICSSKDSVYIEVFLDVPSPDFSVSNVCEGDSTIFLGSSGLSANNIQFLWSLGYSAQNILHPLNIGDNSVTLIVENLDNNCIDSITKNVEIYSNPEASFLSTVSCEGDNTVFTDISSSDVVHWIWNMGDGIGYDSVQNPIYTYLSSGIYLVTLDVISNQGCKNSANIEVVVNSTPVARFNTINEQCVGEVCYFQDISFNQNGSITSWNYNFGDGTNIGINQNDSHVYVNSGIYNVILTVSNSGGCKDSTSKLININPLPEVDFSVSDFCINTPTLFSNHSIINQGSIVLFQWDFGDSSPYLAMKDPFHEYIHDGEYNVKLTAFSDKGCQLTQSNIITIFSKPNLDFMITDSVCVGDTVLFEGLSIDIQNWNWSFGDGVTSNLQSPKHIYQYASNFDLHLLVVDDNGCSNDTLIFSYITVLNTPESSFLFNKSVIEEGSAIEFYNTSVGGDDIFWDFNNGIFSIENNPIITFEDTGKYFVSLDVLNEYSCSDNVTHVINVFSRFSCYIPNSFTPNQDGNNDIFYVQGNGINEFELFIYDRWGKLVFSSLHKDIGWDGKDLHGDFLQQGQYAYHLTLSDINNRVRVYNGELNLMK